MSRTQVAPITQALAASAVAVLVQRVSGGSVQVTAVCAAAAGALLPAVSAFVLDGFSQEKFRAWWAALGPPKWVVLAAALFTAAIAAVRLSQGVSVLLGVTVGWILVTLALEFIGHAWLLRHPLTVAVLGGAAVIVWRYSGVWTPVWLLLGYGVHLALAAWVGAPGLPWGARLWGVRAGNGRLRAIMSWGLATVAIVTLVLALLPFPPRMKVPTARDVRRWGIALVSAVAQPVSKRREPPPPMRWPLGAAAGAEAALVAAGMLAGRRRPLPKLGASRVMPWRQPVHAAAGITDSPRRASTVDVVVPADLPAAADAISLLLPVHTPRDARLALATLPPPNAFRAGDLGEYTVRIGGAPAVTVRLRAVPASARRCGVRGPGELWQSAAFPSYIDQVIAEAFYGQARAFGHVALTEWHILRAMLLTEDGGQLMPAVMDRLSRLPKTDVVRAATGILVAPSLVAVLARAAQLAAMYPDAVTPWYPLWIALLEPPSTVASLLERRGWSAGALRGEWMSWRQTQRDRPAPPPRVEPTPPRTEPAPRPTQAESLRQDANQPKVPADLAEFTTDLVAEARAGRLPSIIGADQPLRDVVQVLLKAELSTPVLLGRAGVGKTAVVHKLAQLLAAGSAALPERLRGMRLLELNHLTLVSDTGLRGTFEARLRKLLDALEADHSAILFVDEIHLIAGAGQAEMGAIPGAAQYLKPVLTRGALRLIGATTPSEYHKFIERDPALARRMTPVHVAEPTEAEAVAIMRGVAPYLATRHQLERVDADAVPRAVEWSRRYLPDKQLPAKAKDLLDRACSAVEQRGGTVVTADDVAEVISRATGIPATRITTAEAEKIRTPNLEAALTERVVGQDAAVSAVAGAIRRARSGMADPRRPVATFLFYGPTGVGKTELAKAVAATFFDSEENFVRINLAEYRTPADAARLTGAPPGYAGAEAGGQLTEAVRRRPYSVLLLDELDKAHPDVLHIFLSVFDEGRLADSAGDVADFTNALVIATSNFGAEAWRNVNPEDPAAAAASARALRSLRELMRPELFNRLQPVAFTPLPPSAMRRLASRRVQAVIDRAAARHRGIQVCVDDKVYDWLARAGYDPDLGARPLERLIEDQLAGRIADAMLAAPAGEGLRLRVAVDSIGVLRVDWVPR